MTTTECKTEWVRFTRGGEAQSAHRACVANHNSTMSCGARHVTCSSPLCALSPYYDRAASEAAREARLAEKAKEGK